MTNAVFHMEDLLDYLLDHSDVPGEAVVTLQFKSAPGNPAAGKLRKHPDVNNIYELLCMAQNGPNTKPFPLSNFFTADEVARVMVPREDLMPKVSPVSSGGLIIPT